MEDVNRDSLVNPDNVKEGDIVRIKPPHQGGLWLVRKVVESQGALWASPWDWRLKQWREGEYDFPIKYVTLIVYVIGKEGSITPSEDVLHDLNELYINEAIDARSRKHSS